MSELILHLLGDYVLQSDWMANNKTKSSVAAGCHALVYSLPFLLLSPSWLAFAVILGTHFLIDRFRLARFVVWGKNCLGSPSWLRMMAWGDLHPRATTDTPEFCRLRWSNCSSTGYPSDTPAWLAVWLLIAADNTLHLAINHAALRWL